MPTKTPHPPHLPDRILQWFCAEEVLETLQGDLYELYQKRREKKGKLLADLHYAFDVVSACRSFAFRRKKAISGHQRSNPYFYFMSGINFRLILRYLGRQKLNTSLHLIGLTIGMSVCLLTGLLLRYELSFDTYYPLADKIYRINSIHTFAGESSFQYASPLPLAEALRAEAPGLENVALAHPQGTAPVEINPGKRFEQDHILIVEPGFLKIFNVEILSGDRSKPLGGPYQALLTETTAKKFFGEEDPVGQTFRFKKDFVVTVTGVIRDMLPNTTLPASMLISYIPDEKFLSSRPAHWTSVNGTSTFVVLPEADELEKMPSLLKGIADRNINERLKGFFQMDFELQPLKSIHLDTKYGGGYWVKAVNPSWLWVMGAIGLSALLLACINFINLSTAQSIRRSKEIGIRKSIGAEKSHLIAQFMGEAFVLSVAAAIVAVCVVYVALPFLNTLLEKNIPFQTSQPLLLPAMFAVVVLVTSALAGFYPAWLITKFNPVYTLKVNSGSGDVQGSAVLRKGLIIAQFALSGILLISVLLMAQQMQLMRGKDLGFNKENIITIPIESGPRDRAVLESTLSQMPEISGLSFAAAVPGGVTQSRATISLTDNTNPEALETDFMVGDERFPDLYDFKLLAGRFPVASDTNYIAAALPDEKKLYKAVLNETAVRRLGFDSNEAALGKRFRHGFRNGNGEIIGVVADFNTNSLHSDLIPVMIMQDHQLYDVATVKFSKGADLAKTLGMIESAWQSVYPDGFFHYDFVDKQIESLYKAEERLYILFKVFACLAIFISCLGLWGLTAYSALQRRKEIGVRKVLGASLNSVMLLLSKDFVVLVAAGLCLASPVAYYFVSRWLEGFAYRITISWWFFVMAGAISVFIALVTISLQTVKAAFANPVEALRSE